MEKGPFNTNLDKNMQFQIEMNSFMWTGPYLTIVCLHVHIDTG